MSHTVLKINPIFLAIFLWHFQILICENLSFFTSSLIIWHCLSQKCFFMNYIISLREYKCATTLIYIKPKKKKMRDGRFDKIFVKIWVGKATWNHVPVFNTSTFQGIYKIERFPPLYIKLHSMIILYISLNSIHNKVNYLFPCLCPWHFSLFMQKLITDKR